MIPNAEQLNEIKKRELEILKAVTDVCDRLGTEYFIVQGTLLGAVRHGGFIPWDDDVDIGMMRPDYDRFISGAQALLPEGLFLQNRYTEPNYPHGFAKVRFTRSAFVEYSCRKLDIDHGIFIDVFPFDRYPDDPIRAAVLNTKKLLLRYRVRSMLCSPETRAPLPKRALQKLLCAVSRAVYPDIEEALDKQTELYGSCKKGRRVISHGSPWGKRELIPAEWVEKTCTLSFEGLSVKAPAGYREYLAKVYGDYMKLPPEEKRVSHHEVFYLNTSRAYDGLAVTDEAEMMSPGSFI